MKIDFCGVALRRLKKTDIEMLRLWRNDRKISQHMFYQEHITSAMQEAWFTSLSADDYYFIIAYNEHALGLIHLSRDESEQESAYAGLFIYEDSYWGTQVPVLASLALLRFAFENLGLNTVKAKIRKENKLAWKYNRQLGFVKVSENLQGLDKASYQSTVRDLIKKIEKTFE